MKVNIHSILLLLVCLIVIAVGGGMLCCKIYTRLQYPQLIAEINLSELRRSCPDMDIDRWLRDRNPWEWVPDTMVARLTYPVVDEDEIVFATYQRRIIRFEPYDFHGVKGTIVEERGEDETIYIYAWDKRYSPCVLQ